MTWVCPYCGSVWDVAKNDYPQYLEKKSCLNCPTIPYRPSKIEKPVLIPVIEPLPKKIIEEKPEIFDEKLVEKPEGFITYAGKAQVVDKKAISEVVEDSEAKKFKGAEGAYEGRKGRGKRNTKSGSDQT